MKSITLLSAILARFVKIFSAPQRKNCAVYIMGLIFMIKFRSIKSISEEFSGLDQSALNHCLTDSPWDRRRLIASMQNELRPRFSKGSVYFVIDDTAVPRSGEHIEAVGIHHSAGKLVKGHCCVAATVLSGKERYLWDVCGYAPKRSCHKSAFRSKVDIAVEFIKNADAGHNDVTVLFDAWYTNKKVASAVIERGWTFISAIKTNRRIELHGKKSYVRHLAKGPRDYVKAICGKNRFKVAKVKVLISGIGDVALFVVKSKRLGTRYIISNDLKISEREAVRAYGGRFWIEAEFREVKQHLGMGELFMRKWQGVQKHWTLVAVAYNIIQLARLSLKRHRTTGAVLRALRKSISHRDINKIISKTICLRT